MNKVNLIITQKKVVAKVHSIKCPVYQATDIKICNALLHIYITIRFCIRWFCNKVFRTKMNLQCIINYPLVLLHSADVEETLVDALVEEIKGKNHGKKKC